MIKFKLKKMSFPTLTLNLYINLTNVCFVDTNNNFNQNYTDLRSYKNNDQ